MNFRLICRLLDKPLKHPGTLFCLMLALAAMLPANAAACPPNPGLAEAIANGDVAAPYYILHKNDLNDRGLNNVAQSASFSGADYTGPFNALAILIQFSDKPAQTAAVSFDSLLYVNQTGSLRHYYSEVSYGQFDVVTVDLPSQLGWTLAPQTYAYYCNNANGTGTYPNNTQKLCEDIINLIDPVVDFSDYDNDHDGVVDGLILIHTGPGAEMTGLNSDIWSHMWAIPTYTVLDGVRIFSYSIQPEYWFDPGDMTCGVYCHEFGHILGLPDLYDTTPSFGADSYGIGSWSLMSYGSWNGSLLYHGGSYYYSGDSPAHFDPWCRIALGFVEDSILTESVELFDIPGVESGPHVYRINIDGDGGDEYFLLENRQKTGYDSFLPGSGLLVWHVDDTQSDNDDRWFPGYTSNGNYLVALEQADGNYDLEQKADRGDAGDPFPGSDNNTVFSPLSFPSSNSYDDANTGIAVSNISPSAETMTADIQITISSGNEDPDEPATSLPASFVLGQNYPNPFNPATRINLELSAPGHVSVTVYDIMGRKVRTLINDDLSAGAIAVDWDGRDAAGRELASGIYFYKAVCNNKSQSKKMLLIR